MAVQKEWHKTLSNPIPCHAFRFSAAAAASRVLRRTASAKLSGFTIVELVVVITVLAVLATVGFLALSGYSSDARDAAAKANVRSVVSAISAESALTGNSPRHYVSHDPDYALSGAYLYVDGDPVALTGGNLGEAPSDSNYAAGVPRWDRLKLDPAKFRTSGLSRDSRLASAFLPALFPKASAAFDKSALSAGAADVSSGSASGRARASSFFQVAWILPETGAAVVAGNFPAPSSADLSASESNGKPAASGFVRNPDSSATEALTDSSSVSAPAGASCGSTPHGGTKTFWTAESVPHGQSCPAGVEFSCDNGNWIHESADKSSYPSEVACVVWTPADCSQGFVEGYALPERSHGEIATGLLPEPSFQNGTKTLLRDFLCSNGHYLAGPPEPRAEINCYEGYESNDTTCLPKLYAVSGSFWPNGAGAEVSVCGSFVTADAFGNFMRMGIPHWSACNDIAATRNGYSCTTTANGPPGIVSNLDLLGGNCAASAFACGTNVAAGGHTYTTKLWPDGKCWTSSNMKHMPLFGNRWCYDNDETMCDIEGALYDWKAANNLCGDLWAGWKLPSDTQWIALTDAGATWWSGNKLSGIVMSLPGYRIPNGSFSGLGSLGYWWSSTEVSISNAQRRYLWSGMASAGFSEEAKSVGVSVVCVKE